VTSGVFFRVRGDEELRTCARKQGDGPAKRNQSKRQRDLLRTPPSPPPPPSPPSPPTPNIHYEAGWSDSGFHYRCFHKHERLLEAAECAMPTGCGWYVFAVENGEPRELSEAEDEVVNRFRFPTRQD
jgi:hypothetical protein